MKCTCDEIGESPCREHGYGLFECDCGMRFTAALHPKSFMEIVCPACGEWYSGQEENCGPGCWRKEVTDGPAYNAGRSEGRARFDSDIAHDKGTATFAPASDTGNRPPKVYWVVETGSSVMGASPPGAHIRAEAESMNSSRVTMRDARPDHGHAHIADVTVWASGPEPLTEETIAVASAIYWSWWRALDMHGEAP